MKKGDIVEHEFSLMSNEVLLKDNVMGEDLKREWSNLETLETRPCKLKMSTLKCYESMINPYKIKMSILKCMKQ